jgi:hypothetical protein
LALVLDTKGMLRLATKGFVSSIEFHGDFEMGLILRSRSSWARFVFVAPQALRAWIRKADMREHQIPVSKVSARLRIILS